MWPHAVHCEDEQGDHKHEPEHHPYTLDDTVSTTEYTVQEDRGCVRSTRGTSSGARQCECQRHSVSTRMHQQQYHHASRWKLTKFSMNPGNVHRIGMNQSVSDKLPKLPAKNVYASHWSPQISAFELWKWRICGRTLRGSSLVKMVTSGMYVTATMPPTIQVLKYKLRNQSCCTEPELTRKSQKQSSSRCVTLRRRGHPIVSAAQDACEMKNASSDVHLERP